MALGHPLAPAAPSRTTMVDHLGCTGIPLRLAGCVRTRWHGPRHAHREAIGGRRPRADTPVARGTRRTTSGTWSRATRRTRVENVTDATDTAGLRVDPALHDFVADELLSGLDLTSAWFWSTVAELHQRFAGRVEQLLHRRDELQERIDGWYREHGPGDVEALEAFLSDIGYLLPLEEPTVRVERVDREIAEVPGPQLVVPATVPRYALNAANARWGSLYDALYGTDALPTEHQLAPGYDERRGAQVIAEADRLLDRFFPLAEGSHADVVAYRVPSPGELAVETPSGTTGLADPAQFAGHRPGDGDGDRPAAVLLRRHGLHLELTVDPSTPVGQQHHAGVSDAVLESAVSTIVDLEDSVATVDGPDKVGAYRTWLGLRTGALTASFSKGGRTVTRTVHGDRSYVGVDGQELTLPGRSLLLVRNVGHHMRLDAVRTADGEPILEEVLDALVSATAAVQEFRGDGRVSNTRTGSVYIVKPKMHGPDEVSVSVDLLAAVEQALGLEPTTLKIGIMDEEKRISTKDRKSTRLNSSHANISHAVFCLQQKTICHLSLPLSYIPYRLRHSTNSPTSLHYEPPHLILSTHNTISRAKTTPDVCAISSHHEF